MKVAGPLRRGRVLIVDRDGAGRAALLGAQHGRDRPYALGADEIGVKGRSQRIAAPGAAGDFGAAFGQQRIVTGDDPWRGGIELGDAATARHGEQAAGVEASLREQAIERRPVLEFGAAGVPHGGDGAAAQPGQSSQHQAFDFLPGAALAASVEGLAGEGLEGAREPRRRVFFKAEGGAWGRLRTS